MRLWLKFNLDKFERLRLLLKAFELVGDGDEGELVHDLEAVRISLAG